MSLVDQELTLSTVDVTSKSRTYTKHDGFHQWNQELTLTRWMSLVDQELTLKTMDVTSGSRTYTKHDGCHFWIKNLH